VFDDLSTTEGLGMDIHGDHAWADLTSWLRRWPGVRFTVISFHVLVFAFSTFLDFFKLDIGISFFRTRSSLETEIKA
jgi:hypothetical protein